MRIPFVKMHGLGNDFVVLDGRAELLPAITAPVARRLAERHEGIGCDQLIVLEPSRTDEAELRMRNFNADGGEVGSCGNASRAVALLVGQAARVETGGGIIAVLPGELAVATFSPALDRHGNSVRGVLACERLSQDLDLHFTHTARVARSTVRASYPIDQSPSLVRRNAEAEAVLADHGKAARGFPDVRANTVPAFALGDYEWILAFEADQLDRIVDLMRHLRATEARRHVREEVPFYTGPRVELGALVAALP